MLKLTELTTYADAQLHYSRDGLWRLFDGTPDQFNIAHECVDRHADLAAPALIVVHPDRPDEAISYAELAAESSRFAHYLAANGIAAGDRVAIMLEPSREFYVSMFGALKAGAIAVPLFTLFGPDGVALRVKDCSPAMLVTNAEKSSTVAHFDKVRLVVFDDDFALALQEYPTEFTSGTRASDLAVYQYTSGTTRELPEAVKHNHQTLVTLMVAALYGTGIRPGDRFMCPSSPAWGHGLWHGTFAPLALGLTVGAYAGKFDPVQLLSALQEHQFTNLSAAATHYRMMRNSGRAVEFKYCINKLSFTGEPIDPESATFARETFGHEVCSMYGTTEIGVVLVNYPGATDFTVKPGSLGKPPPGVEVEVQDDRGDRCAPGVVGQLMVRRRGEWIPTRDLGQIDEDGYFFHCGRADDVIISAGWTMSAVEIENAVLMHRDVREVAAIGVPDELRGNIVKAFVVTERAPDDTFTKEIQDLVRTKLSQHEYPRQIVFVPSLPKTPAGKINRKALRDSERQRESDTI